MRTISMIGGYGGRALLGSSYCIGLLMDNFFAIDTQSSITKTWIIFFRGSSKHHTPNVHTFNSVFPQRTWSDESVRQKLEKLYELCTVASYKEIVICHAFYWRVDLSVGALVMWNMFANRQHCCKTSYSITNPCVRVCMCFDERCRRGRMSELYVQRRRIDNHRAGISSMSENDKHSFLTSDSIDLQSSTRTIGW